MIKASNITKSYDNLTVLKGIDFEASKSEVVTIVGASGAGKSSLLQILGSLLKPDKGEVLIDNVNIFSLNDTSLSDFRNKKIGFVFQFHHLLQEFNAVENVMIPALIAKRGKSESYTEARKILVSLGLEDRLFHKPNELSGGEQQRVAIARAIINNPLILFADEPSGNLDTKSKGEIHKLFFDIRDQYGTTIIIVTHDKELAQMSDRTLEMKDGTILF